MSKNWVMGSAPEGEITKISAQQFYAFDVKHWQDQHGMRYGQAFLNTFFPTIVDPELFYDDQPLRAADRIEAYYVEVE